MRHKKQARGKTRAEAGSMYPNKRTFFAEMALLEQELLTQQAIEDERDRAAGRENTRCPLCGGRRAADLLQKTCQWCGNRVPSN